MKYLGVMIDGKLVFIRFHQLMLEKMRKKSAWWKLATISFAGRVVLLRLLLATIPMYSFVNYWIPK